MDTQIAIPNVTAFEKKAMAVLSAAHKIVVKDDATFQKATTFLKDLKGYQKELDETFNDSIRAAKAAHTAALDAKKKLAVPIEEAEGIVKDVLADYDEKVRAKIEDDRREAQRKADKQAEDDRKAAAKQAEKSGDKKLAKEILATPLAPAPIAAPTMEAPKAEGVVFKDKWHGEVFDMKAFIGDPQVPVAVLSIAQAKLDAYAAATQGNVKIAGVRFYKTREVASRAA